MPKEHLAVAQKTKSANINRYIDVVIVKPTLFDTSSFIEQVSHCSDCPNRQIGSSLVEIALQNWVRRASGEINGEFSTHVYSLLDQRLHRLGKRRLVVPGDGNCFFHCIEKLFQRIPELSQPKPIAHIDIRDLAASYIVENFKRFSPYFPLDIGQSDAEYAAKLFHDGEWADDPIINATAEVLGVTIIVYRTDGAPDNVINSHRPITLDIAFKHTYPQHYDAITDIPLRVESEPEKASSNVSVTDADACVGCGGVPDPDVMCAFGGCKCCFRCAASHTCKATPGHEPQNGGKDLGKQHNNIV